MGDAVEAEDGWHIALNSTHPQSLLSLLLIIISSSGWGGVYNT